MYRMLFTAIWALIFGALTAAALAWIPAYLKKSTDVTVGRASVDERLWQVHMINGPMLDHVRLEQARMITFGGPSGLLNGTGFDSIPINLPTREQSPYLRSYEVICTGWPLRAFRTSRSFDLTTIDPLAEVWTHGAVLDDGMLMMMEPLAAKVLPYGPIWSGLFGNLAIWCGAWFALFMTVGAARSAHRRARGRCAHCAYELAGVASGKCPECGETVKSHPDV